jgi:rRNA-processing protein EBP2
MAKVKDRLIFETKKMDAVEQRKANKEQRLRSKEKNATRLVEKAQMRKEHAQAVEQWQSSSLANQGNPFDNKQVPTPNKKRIASDLKYGRGGKRGRFKQNDPRSKNDMSDYNPKGNFAGIGSKRSKRSTSSTSRPGKRTRDAKRSSKT